MNYCTADFHFAHENIIKYTHRPFRNAREMDRAMIRNYNSIVGDDDLVYILGDFCMSRNKRQVEDYVDKLNGTKILILGNHDYLNPFDYIECGFQSVHTSLYLPQSPEIAMNHDPAVACLVPKLLCGHVHGLFKLQGNALNVGVDVWDFKPVPLVEILLLLDHISL